MSSDCPGSSYLVSSWQCNLWVDLGNSEVPVNSLKQSAYKKSIPWIPMDLVKKKLLLLPCAYLLQRIHNSTYRDSCQIRCRYKDTWRCLQRDRFARAYCQTFFCHEALELHRPHGQPLHYLWDLGISPWEGYFLHDHGICGPRISGNKSFQRRLCMKHVVAIKTYYRVVDLSSYVQWAEGYLLAHGLYRRTQYRTFGGELKASMAIAICRPKAWPNLILVEKQLYMICCWNWGHDVSCKESEEKAPPLVAHHAIGGIATRVTTIVV